MNYTCPKCLAKTIREQASGTVGAVSQQQQAQQQAQLAKERAMWEAKPPANTCIALALNIGDGAVKAIGYTTGATGGDMNVSVFFAVASSLTAVNVPEVMKIVHQLKARWNSPMDAVREVSASYISLAGSPPQGGEATDVMWLLDHLADSRFTKELAVLRSTPLAMTPLPSQDQAPKSVTYRPWLRKGG